MSYETAVPNAYLAPAADAPPVDWVAEHRLRRQVTRDKWWLAAIILERFVTRLFSDKLGLLPDWTNFLDYPMLVAFGVHVLFSVRYRPTLQVRTGFRVLVAALLVNFGIAALANLGRLHTGAAALFAVGFLEPLAFMWLAFILAPKPEVIRFLVKGLFFVGWLQIVVVALWDWPIFLITKNPDFISGTFGENAYQLTFFLLTWNALILSQPAVSRFRIIRLVGIVFLQIIILTIFLLAQFRALLPFAFVTWMFTYILVNKRPTRGVVAAALGGCIFVVAFSQINTLFPELKWGDMLQLANRAEETEQSGKVQSIFNLGRLIADQPHVLLLGTGPGTYASRGFMTFSIAGKGASINRYYRRIFHTDYYVTDVAAQYTLPIANKVAFGSATAALPWFSYNALPAELGVIGLVLVLAIYGKAIHLCWRISKGQDELAALSRWVLVAMILLVQMGFLENWFEVSRLTVPTWTVFGVVLAQVRHTGYPM